MGTAGSPHTHGLLFESVLVTGFTGNGVWSQIPEYLLLKVISFSS